jgi:hypothetical protein
MATPTNKSRNKTFALIGSTGVTFWKSQLRSKKKVATGKTYNSIKFKLDFGIFNFSLSFFADKAWRFIVLGRGKNKKWPPSEEIREWIRARKIKPQRINGRLPSEEGLLFLVRRKIGRDGIPKTDLYAGARGFFANIVETKANNAIREDLQETVFQEMSGVADSSKR